MRAEDYAWPATGSNRGRSSGPSGSSGLSDLTVEELGAQRDVHAKAIEASKARMLRMTEEASQSGAATLTALSSQREDLERIRANQQRIDSDLATSDRLLRGMESWRSAAANAVSSWWYGGDDGAAATAPAAAAPAVARAGAPVAGTRRTCAPAATAAHRSRPAGSASATAGSIDDDAMSQLSGLVSGLCAQAHAMNAEISAQSTMVDVACNAADAQSAHMQRNAQRTKKLAG